MNWHLIISLLLVLDIILMIVRCVFFKQKQRASSEEARRQRNEAVVACLECGADLVRVDRLQKGHRINLMATEHAETPEEERAAQKRLMAIMERRFAA